MVPSGIGPDGSDYFLMLLNGRVLLQQSVIGKAGQVYRFNVTVSVYCLRKIHISIPTFVKFAEHNSNFLWGIFAVADGV